MRAAQEYSVILELRNECAGDLLSMARFLGFEVAPVHELMAQSDSLDRSLILAPRGFGKSTILSVVRCVFEIVRDPDVRILLASNTQPQAEAFVSEVRGHFERNRVFRRVFGDFVGRKWTDRRIIVGPRKRIAKEPTIFAVGVGGGLVSKHFDIIICDDIIDEESARTEAQRERLRVWFFKVLLPCLEPHGKLCIIGTRYHYRDLYGHLAETGFAPVTLIRAIGSDGTSAWPEKFSTEKLETIRRQAGTVIFNTQYQNDTEAMKGAIFKEEWLRFHDTPPEPLIIFQGVDLSIAQEAGSDYFAIVTIGVDEWSNIYVLDCFQARLSFRQQAAAILERYKRFDPVKVAIESNAYQAVQVERVKELGVVRATKVFTTRDKLSRAWKLSALFEDGRVRLSRNMHELVEQLLAFPQAEHDDLIDALDLAIGIAASPGPKMRFF